MKVRIFNKFLIGIALVLLISAGAVKIHSIWSFPTVNDWNYRQLQRIDKRENKFSFIVFADNKNSITTFNSLIRKVNKEKAEFAIDIGDLVYDGEKEKFMFFINQIRKFNKPLLTVIGNHEIKEKGRANYYNLFGRFYYSFAVGDNYFIMLDDANERNIDPWQMSWLKSELQKSKEYRHLFVFMHVPLYDPRKGERREGHSLRDLAFANKLNSLFDEYKVTMLFSSHIHAYYKGVWGKTPYIITGGAGAELAGSSPLHYFYHYIKVDVSNNGIRYKVVRLKSPRFELADRFIHDGWIYIYAFFAIHLWDLLIIIPLLYLGIYIVFMKRNWLVKDAGKKN